jgi:hypothetical protein
MGGDMEMSLKSNYSIKKAVINPFLIETKEHFFKITSF